MRKSILFLLVSMLCLPLAALAAAPPPPAAAALPAPAAVQAPAVPFDLSTALDAVLAPAAAHPLSLLRTPQTLDPLLPDAPGANRICVLSCTACPCTKEQGACGTMCA